MQLRVNGDVFFVRGINGGHGIEWDNDRTVTRREFLRLLRFYQQLGLNAIRIEGPERWQLDEAFSHGMMVMPVTAAASCNLSVSALGQLEAPDLDQAVDRQRLLAILLAESPNVLLWNGGNEIHHTPGYTDKPILGDYLTQIQTAFKQYDPDRRMVTYANLDTWAINWFFFEGQDVIGWNIYEVPEVFRQHWQEISARAGDRPILFTEWGTFQGKKDRDGKVDEWEEAIRQKWALISGEKQSTGAFYYAFHGATEDDRGRAFLQSLLLPFTLDIADGKLRLTNRDRAPMREVSLIEVTDANAPLSRYAEVIAPGESVEFDWNQTVPGSLELRYDTHHGLKHFFTKELP
jgi:hypothetical protein